MIRAAVGLFLGLLVAAALGSLVSVDLPLMLMAMVQATGGSYSIPTVKFES